MQPVQFEKMIIIKSIKNKGNFTKGTENPPANSLAKHIRAVTLADLQNLRGRIVTGSKQN